MPLEAIALSLLNVTRMIRPDRGDLALRLMGPKVDPPGTEVGDFLARANRPFENVLAPGDFESLEPSGHDRGLERCFQQRPSYSVGPEVDVALGALRDLLLHGDIGDLEPSTGPEHPEDLLEYPILGGRQVDDPVGDHEVGPAIANRE